MGLDPENLKLTDFMDLPTLQEIQDSFAAVADVKATITDADGAVLTQPTPTREFLRRQKALAEEGEQPQREGAEFVAPIVVNNQRLGTVRMSARATLNGVDDEKLIAIGAKYGMDLKQVRSMAGQISKSKNSKGAAIQFLFLLANAITRLCYQEYQLRQRINELTAVYGVAMMLADARDLQQVLRRTVQVVAEVMETKAASLRLYDPRTDELKIKAVYNLSAEYLNKGPVVLASALIDRVALSPVGFEYVPNMSEDPRVLYQQESAREGIVSMLSAGMRYKGKPIGVLRVYTEKQQLFSPYKIEMLKAVAAQAAAAIENARLLNESIAAAALEKQVQMAADVQQRMIPHQPPLVPGIDLASAYLPCFELGGDFFDFIPLPDDNIGLTVADVSGKGVPASLIMASVRAFLRAQVDNVYYLYEVVRRINLMLCRDTKPGEFVTLFYGVLNARTRRLTHCNAGHVPPLLLRDGKVTEVPGDNMVLGVNPDEAYKQFILDLEPGDVLLLYTDGLTDAMNSSQERFGRQRATDALQQGGASAGAIAQNVLEHLRAFVGNAKRTDDVTMIVAKVG
ncbi:MAG TPA: SpoIIE family protein phosphatase [Tepidisphaeraceae bacterium]|jgi:sigma-B regulation protein RsbU (phosphoserine phosphatase)|nr:SpoIIE family protein phosphatase [Tepidisphaeraceae bacterium]